MDVFSRLRGTLLGLFQIGRGGPQLKSSSGALEARNATDTAFAVVRGGAPSGANDLVPLAFATPVYTGAPAALAQGAKLWTTTATTSATGALTVALPAGLFTTILSVTATVIDSAAAARFPKVKSVSTSQVVLQVYEQVLILLLSTASIGPATAAVSVQVTVLGT